jgi:hypothetical protein
MTINRQTTRVAALTYQAKRLICISALPTATTPGFGQGNLHMFQNS